MNVLVTGAAGRLGSCVCRLLDELGMTFTAVDCVSDVEAAYSVKIVDLLDWEACEELLKEIDVLIHFASNTKWDSDSPQDVLKENTSMDMNLFQAAANSGCSRIIFSSSIQVCNGQLPVGDRAIHEIVLPYIPIDSDMPTLARNGYSLSKQIAAEVAVKAITAELSGYRQYFVSSKDNLEQRPAREVIEEQLSDIPSKIPLEEMDSLVDCSKVEAELGWEQPRTLEESLEAYGRLAEVAPY